MISGTVLSLRGGVPLSFSFSLYLSSAPLSFSCIYTVSPSPAVVLSSLPLLLRRSSISSSPRRVSLSRGFAPLYRGLSWVPRRLGSGSCVCTPRLPPSTRSVTLRHHPGSFRPSVLPSFLRRGRDERRVPASGSKPKNLGKTLLSRASIYPDCRRPVP